MPELACLHLELELQKQFLVLLSVLMGPEEDSREGDTAGVWEVV